MGGPSKISTNAGFRTAYEAGSDLFGPDEAMRLSLEMAGSIEIASGLDSGLSGLGLSVLTKEYNSVPPERYALLIGTWVGDGYSSFIFETDVYVSMARTAMRELIVAMAHEMFQPEAVPA